jgi:hypothetical protein
MIVIISPSKTLDFSGKTNGEYSIYDFSDESRKLIAILRTFSAKQIADLMSLSEKLSTLNWQRYQNFNNVFTPENARQAMFAFQGDVYDGLAAGNFNQSEIAYSQSHLRIISGLYGLLRPLDLIQPYRLEMGTRLANQNGKDLYKFWGDKITNKLNESMENSGCKILINLASEEYFKAINKKILYGRIITPVFMEKKGDAYRIVALYAKQARGMMAGYIIKNQVETSQGITQFNEAGYKFNPHISTDDRLVFTR